MAEKKSFLFGPITQIGGNWQLLPHQKMIKSSYVVNRPGLLYIFWAPPKLDQECWRWRSSHKKKDSFSVNNCQQWNWPLWRIGPRCWLPHSPPVHTHTQTPSTCLVVQTSVRLVQVPTYIQNTRLRMIDCHHCVWSICSLCLKDINPSNPSPTSCRTTSTTPFICLWISL